MTKETHIHVFHKTCGIIVEAAPDRWVLELTDIDCNPPQLVGWKEFKTKGKALDYADLCMKD